MVGESGEDVEVNVGGAGKCNVEVPPLKGLDQ